jgi:hypothetical protein
MAWIAYDVCTQFDEFTRGKKCKILKKFTLNFVLGVLWFRLFENMRSEVLKALQYFPLLALRHGGDTLWIRRALYKLHPRRTEL